MSNCFRITTDKATYAYPVGYTAHDCCTLWLYFHTQPGSTQLPKGRSTFSRESPENARNMWETWMWKRFLKFSRCSPALLHFLSVFWRETKERENVRTGENVARAPPTWTEVIVYFVASIVIERENCSENYLRTLWECVPKEVLPTVLAENLRRFSRECGAPFRKFLQRAAFFDYQW